MPPRSATDNVRKICKCVKWKTCSHPWYLDYQRDKVRFRQNLDKLIDKHAADFIEAKDEARRAINALLSGRDPKGLLPTDDPTLEQMLTDYEGEKPRRDTTHDRRICAIELPSPQGARRFGDWRLTQVTLDTLKQYRHLRPLVTGNRDLALLR